ncbi:MAG TPA: type II toxin-antitoxin system RelE/ParE family toxin [Kofleriaceae bacterium]|nr:type II toxin-antitoxin system RelE/ParE family toxin [Kofleriaceae bacterium]
MFDLEQIAAHIALDDPDTAERWVLRLAARARRIGAFPRSGRVVAEYREPSIREVFLGNHRIIYRVDPSRMLVLKFLEGHKRALRR